MLFLPEHISLLPPLLLLLPTLNALPIQNKDTVLLLDRYACLAPYGKGDTVWNAHLEGYVIQLTDPVKAHPHLTKWAEKYLNLNVEDALQRRQRFRYRLSLLFGKPSQNREVAGIASLITALKEGHAPRTLPSSPTSAPGTNSPIILNGESLLPTNITAMAPLPWPIQFPGVYTDENGAFKAENILFPGRVPAGSVLSYNISMPANDTRTVPGSFFLFKPRGWMVVSDIDDTIKVTGAINATMTMRNMFANDYHYVPGMPHLYQHLLNTIPLIHNSPKGVYRTEIDRLAALPPVPGNVTLPVPGVHEDISFYYLSGSPWRMGGPLHEFIQDSHYPPGVLELSGIRVNRPYSVYVHSDIGRYKIGRIRALLDDFPERNWIWIGDSGQADPRVYADMYREVMRRQPQRKTPPCIFIRHLEGVDAEKELLLNTAERFRWDFRGIPADRWMVFRDPRVIEQVDFAAGKCYPDGEINAWVDPWKAHSLTMSHSPQAPVGSDIAEKDDERLGGTEETIDVIGGGAIEKVISEKFWLRKGRFQSMRRGWKHLLGLQ